MLISVLVTTLNEMATVDEFISRIDKVFEAMDDDYEIIFVDDQSTDGSLEKIIEYTEKDSRIKLIEMTRQFGRHECYTAGFKYVSGEYVVMLDSDLQDPPELIPELLNKIKLERADIIHTVMKKRLGESWFKLFLTHISYRILNSVCSIPMPENAGQFKILAKSVVDDLKNIDEKNLYYKGLINWTGRKQILYPFERDPRHAGETKFSLWGHRPYQEMIKAITGFSYFPLYLPTILSAVMLPLLIVIMAVFNFEVFEIVATSLLYIIIVFQALIALYLIGVHSNSSGRPAYLIQKRYGFKD